MLKSMFFLKFPDLGCSFAELVETWAVPCHGNSDYVCINRFKIWCTEQKIWKTQFGARPEKVLGLRPQNLKFSTNDFHETLTKWSLLGKKLKKRADGHTVFKTKICLFFFEIVMLKSQFFLKFPDIRCSVAELIETWGDYVCINRFEIWCTEQTIWKHDSARAPKRFWAYGLKT